MECHILRSKFRSHISLYYARARAVGLKAVEGNERKKRKKEKKKSI